MRTRKNGNIVYGNHQAIEWQRRPAISIADGYSLAVFEMILNPNKTFRSPSSGAIEKVETKIKLFIIENAEK